MADLIITEFRELVANPVPAAIGKNVVTSQAILMAGTSTASAAVNANTTVVRVYAEARCSIAIGPGPTATADAQIALEADQPEYFGVAPGDKIAVITRA